jgi:hypothetical protein
LSVQPPIDATRHKRSNYYGGSTLPPAPLNDNNILFDNSGNLRTPGTTVTVKTVSNADYGREFTFAINYDAILYWIKNCGTNPFPDALRSGGVLYYSKIPDTIALGQWPVTDPDQRFWKEYIDEVLGYQQIGAGGTYSGYSIGQYQIVTDKCGYGADFVWGTNTIRQKPIVQQDDLGSPIQPPYMDYRDNPKRGYAHWWFGPMTMLDFLGNFNVRADYTPGSNKKPRLWWPGTCHEAPTWQCKIGMAGALTDMKQNHPNDKATLVLFSVPNSPNTPPANGGPVAGQYNAVPVPLSQNYTNLLDALWFSPESIANKAEYRPYDAYNADVPRAVGGTCYAMPLMLVYNQYNIDPAQRTFAPAPAPTGQAGGLGRRGAQKTIIFETDGMVAATAYSSFGALFKMNSTPGYSYFAVRWPTEAPDYVVGDPVNSPLQAQAVAQAICNLETDPNTPGYATTRKKVLLHTIAFGSLFNSSNTSSYKTNALNVLQSLQAIGNTQEAPGAPNDPTTPLPSYRVITGPASTRISNLQTAFTNILQDGLQLALIK